KPEISSESMCAVQKLRSHWATTVCLAGVAVLLVLLPVVHVLLQKQSEQIVIEAIDAVERMDTTDLDQPWGIDLVYKTLSEQMQKAYRNQSTSHCDSANPLYKVALFIAEMSERCNALLELKDEKAYLFAKEG